MKHTLFSNGRRIAYYSNGATDSRLLVLLHGFCEDSNVWDDFVLFFKNMPVVRVDLPGFGDSNLPLNPGMDVYADAVCAVLNDLSIEKCVLIGHSMGGYTALEFAAKYPERLAGLGLFHSHPFEDSPERKEARHRGIEMLRAGKRDLYVAQLFPGLFAESFGKTNPEVINALINRGKRQSPEAIVAALEGMILRKNHLETLRSISCPTQFIFGAEDTIATPEQGLQAAVLPNIADVHVLPGVGHMGMFEAPEKCAAIVRQFWEFCATQ
ncbi:MAG: alpha/beta hydrolase [Saprospiraceae bacterium]